jgi:hypothetical protein
MNITLNFLNRSKMAIILEDQLLKVRNTDRTKKNKKIIFVMRLYTKTKNQSFMKCFHFRMKIRWHKNLIIRD